MGSLLFLEIYSYVPIKTSFQLKDILIQVDSFSVLQITLYGKLQSAFKEYFCLKIVAFYSQGVDLYQC